MNFRNEILTRVNNERAANGLKPLSMNFELNKAGDVRAKEIVTRFAHTRPDGTFCFTALDGLNLPYYSYMGENIASGFPDPSSVMNGWMNSPTHKENILSTNYKYVGIGVVYSGGKYHWTQIFIG